MFGIVQEPMGQLRYHLRSLVGQTMVYLWSGSARALWRRTYPTRLVDEAREAAGSLRPPAILGWEYLRLLESSVVAFVIPDYRGSGALRSTERPHS